MLNKTNGNSLKISYDESNVKITAKKNNAPATMAPRIAIAFIIRFGVLIIDLNLILW